MNGDDAPWPVLPPRRVFKTYKYPAFFLTEGCSVNLPWLIVTMGGKMTPIKSALYIIVVTDELGRAVHPLPLPGLHSPAQFIDQKWVIECFLRGRFLAYSPYQVKYQVKQPHEILTIDDDAAAPHDDGPYPEARQASSSNTPNSSEDPPHAPSQSEMQNDDSPDRGNDTMPQQLNTPSKRVRDDKDPRERSSTIRTKPRPHQ